MTPYFVPTGMDFPFVLRRSIGMYVSISFPLWCFVAIDERTASAKRLTLRQAGSFFVLSDSCSIVAQFILWRGARKTTTVAWGGGFVKTVGIRLSIRMNVGTRLLWWIYNQDLRRLCLLHPTLSVGVSTVLFVSQFLHSGGSRGSFTFYIDIILFYGTCSVYYSGFVKIVFVVSLNRCFDANV